MDLKFFLNKIMKTDNIEHYTIGTLFKLRDTYDQFMEKSGGYDPDFPMTGLTAGGNSSSDGKQNIKIKGKNVYSEYDEDKPDPNFEGIKRSAISKAMSNGKINNID